MSTQKGKSSTDHILRVLLIGNSSVGKTCILKRFAGDEFDPNFITTIGVDFKIKTIEYNGKKIQLQVWDTAGQERFQSITKTYYRGAKGIIIVYDITNAKSFEDVKKWLRSIEENSGDDVVTVIIGNKSDMESLRSVSIEDAKALAKETKSGFLETSAKNNVNIDEAFILLASAILNKMYQPQPRGGGQTEDLPTRKLSHKSSNRSRKSKGGCC